MELYKALVRPLLEYAHAVWSPHSRGHRKCSKQGQPSKVTTINGLDYEERLRKLNLLTLVYRRLRGDIIEVYKVVPGIYDPSVLSDLLALYQDVIGHNFKLANKSSRLDFKKICIYK